MLRYSDNLKADDDYANSKNLVYGKNGWFKGWLVTQIVLADYNLRGSVQRADYLEEQLHALQKIHDIGDDKEKTQLQNFDEELRIIGRKICLLKRNLYEVEAKFTGSVLADSYEILRQDP
jgi:hypothetical protein